MALQKFHNVGYVKQWAYEKFQEIWIVFECPIKSREFKFHSNSSLNSLKFITVNLTKISQNLPKTSSMAHKNFQIFRRPSSLPNQHMRCQLQKNQKKRKGRVGPTWQRDVAHLSPSSVRPASMRGATRQGACPRGGSLRSDQKSLPRRRPRPLRHSPRLHRAPPSLRSLFSSLRRIAIAAVSSSSSQPTTRPRVPSSNSRAPPPVGTSSRHGRTPSPRASAVDLESSPRSAMARPS